MDRIEQPLESAWLEPGTLWTQTVARTQTALECGALQPLSTNSEWMEQDGICFLVRILVNLGRKEAAHQAQQQDSDSGKPFNPFLPYDPALFVSHLSATHTCLLNKYNVVEHHWLIVTRQFEPQEAWLNLADLEALWICLKEIDGLGFYNSCRLAGASQPHKHLQLLPLPLAQTTEVKVPIEAAFATAVWQDGIGICSALPFRHALARLPWNATASPRQAAQITLDAYHRLLTALELADSQFLPELDRPVAYNFLITREWLLLIPRSQEQFESISVNALGFAGTLFVRDAAQFERLKAIGPLALLTGVAVP